MSRTAQPQDADRAAAAAYVEAHLPLLTAYSRATRFRPAWVDPDEFRSDLVDQVLTAHHTFRTVNHGSDCRYCGGSGCATWIGWRARKAASLQRHRQKRDRDRFQLYDEAEDFDAVPSPTDHPGRIEARAQVQALFDFATPDQREALLSKLEGWTGDEVFMRLGIGLGGRNYRLAQLMKRLNEKP